MIREKYLLFIFMASLLTSYNLYGQVKRDNTTEIRLRVTQPKGLSTDKAIQILQKRLEQAVVLNDAASENSPFLLETEILLLSCQTTPSTPVQVVAELEMICSITDKLRGETIQQVDFQFTGIDTTRKKAILNAIKQLRARDPQLKKLITRGIEKLKVNYQMESQEIHESQNTQK